MRNLRFFLRNSSQIFKISAPGTRSYNVLPLNRKYNLNFPSIQQLNLVRLSQTKVLKCWNCGADRELNTNLICDKCNVIQEPHVTGNYFKVLNVPECFDIDLKSLTTTYRRLQATLHPDKFSNKGEREKSISADYSSLVNKAYNVLQQPLSRAIHMLNLKGERIEEDQKVSDPQFLMEIMELNEEIEEADSSEALRELNRKNSVTLSKLGQEVSKHFLDGDVKKAKETVVKMKYYNSISLRINNLMRERGIVD